MIRKLRHTLRATVHGAADELLTRAVGGPKLFSGGFGALEELDMLVEVIRNYDAQLPAPIPDIAWDEPTIRGRAEVRRGTFESPASPLLPEPTRRARVELHLPRRGSTERVCLLLAATGEEGFTLRRRVVGDLLREHIGALLLENPFYGSRRPRGQRLSLLRTVRDQFAMNTATVDEARALLRWLAAQGYRPGASGYSQGGMMTAFAAALSDFPVAAVPCAAGLRAAPVFTEHALARRFDWNALARSFPSEAHAREHFARCLEPVDVGRFPSPTHPSSAILVGARFDGYIPEHEVAALHRHWTGAELRWVETGHLTGALLFKQVQVRAIVDAFERLP